MDVLGKVVSWRRELVRTGKARSFDNPFSHIDLLGHFYSNRIWLLENHEHYLKELEFLLDSLVASGDLRRLDHHYVLDGKSLKTLSLVEEERRRYSSDQKHNTSIRLLTWILALAATIQLLANVLPKDP